MLTTKDIERAIARRDFRKFVAQTWRNYQPNRFHDVLCRKLQQFYNDLNEGKQPKLLITVPPRHGKSWIASQRFPVWVLGHNPEWEIIMASYSSSLATEHSRMARRLLSVDKLSGEPELAADIFRKLRLNPNKQSMDSWETIEGGRFSAMGLLGSATGKGCNVLIIDDPIKGFE